MRIVIVTNQKSAGLALDAELVSGFLVARGHEVAVWQFDDLVAERAEYDLAIFMEVPVAEFMTMAPVRWLFANPEWTKPEYHRLIQRSIHKVFAKTRAAERVLRERFQGVTYTGFLARDRRDLTIERAPTFLHVAGKSGFKNTQAVIGAWRSYRYWNGIGAEDAELTVVGRSVTVTFEPTPGVTFIRDTDDDQITFLMNRNLFHLCPSAYEGFGHAVHEAHGVGAVVLTTSAGPMAELKAPFEVPSVRERKNNLGILHEVSPAAIREAVPRMLAQPNVVVARMQVEARARFEAGNREFEQRFEPLVEGVVRSLQGRQTGDPAPTRPIALLGNFGPPHSTENELLWSLRDMGEEVLSFQENEARTEDILEECVRGNVKLLLYIHTHGWETPGKISVLTLIERLRAAGVKTASFHLDRYWGLNQLDRREDRVGEHPFFHTDCVFTADGGNQERFKSRGVQHTWLPPGVVKRDCYLGNPREDLKIDVGFIGATSYHPEHAFRGILISFLQSIYGERFRVFQGYRGQDLNDLCASVRVVVGDSCFGGAPRYWSDRSPELLGRGAFLLHPQSEGLMIPGLVQFTPEDLGELQDKIDWFLGHETERKACVVTASGWVKENETYHNRMRDLLGRMGL